MIAGCSAQTFGEAGAIISPLELSNFRYVSRLVMAINGNHQRESDRGFGSSNRDREERDKRICGRLGLGSETPECDKIQIGRGKHHFDTNKNENRMTPT